MTDFGLTSELLTEALAGKSGAERDVSNPTWLAPEVLQAKPYGLASDVYALGSAFLAFNGPVLIPFSHDVGDLYLQAPLLRL